MLYMFETKSLHTLNKKHHVSFLNGEAVIYKNKNELRGINYVLEDETGKVFKNMKRIKSGFITANEVNPNKIDEIPTWAIKRFLNPVDNPMYFI